MHKFLFLHKLLIVMALALFQSSQLLAQINTEKFRKYDAEDGFLFNLQTTFTLKSGNTEYNAIKAAGRIDHSGGFMDYFLVGNIEAKNTPEKRIQNQGFAHLRGMWEIAEKTTWETFVQRQYDEFIDLNYRTVIGSAIKYRFFESYSINDSTNVLNLNVSTGLMYEHENYKMDPENIDRRLWRSTNFVSFDWSKQKRMSFTGVVYYQPAFNNFSDYRVAAETTLEFSIVQKLFFTVQFTCKYNNLPVTDVKKYDLSLENGLRFEFR